MNIFIKNIPLTFSFVGGLLLAGFFAVFNTPIEALPDLSENQVIVMSEWNGQNPKDIEDLVTYPITVAMQNLAGVKTVRGMSQMGVSMVTIIFEDNIDQYFARNRVFEKLSTIKNILPDEVNSVIGPDATGLGHIFMYTIESPYHSLQERKAMQDFLISYELQSIAGIAEIAPVGGKEKIYNVILDPYKMESHHISITTVINTLKNVNKNVSGKVITDKDREIAVQGIGYFQSLEEIENIMITNHDGESIRLSNIGKVKIDDAFRRSILANDHEETVGAIVVMRQGENPKDIIEKIEKKIIEIEKLLPEGVTIKPFYNQKPLIENATKTFRGVIEQEIFITIIILGFFLWNIGATFIASFSLFLSIILVFLCMYIFKIPFNIMSLGGIAIAVGTMVDAIIVIIDNSYSKLQKGIAQRAAIETSLQEVFFPLLSAIVIITLSFIPLLFLNGMEGKLFSPLAWTNIFSMLCALFVALFIVPSLCIVFLKGKIFQDNEIPVSSYLQKKYQSFLSYIFKWKKISITGVAILTFIGGIIFISLDSEFMPELGEGSLLYMPVTFPDISEEQASKWLIESNNIISKIPEVKNVVGKSGRAKSATDPAPLSMFETFITLKPQKEWRDGYTKDDIVREIYTNIKIPGLLNSITQPIIGRIGMMSTGIAGEVGLKIYGNDTQVLEDLSIQASDIIGEYVPGAYGNAPIKTSGLRYLQIDIDEYQLGVLGIPKNEVLNIISAGIGGMKVSNIFIGRERFALEVEIEDKEHQDIESIKNLWVHQQDVSTIQLKDIADISVITGPAVIKSENGKIYGAMQTDVLGIGVVDFVKKAQEVLDKNLLLPEGYTLEWTGQYKNQINAMHRLSIIIPLLIIFFFLLLFFLYKDFILTIIIMICVPIGMIGGVISLFIAGLKLSIAVWVGFIALFGNVIETAMVMMMSLQSYAESKNNISFKEIQDIATRRIRPVIMTALTSIIGLLPLIFSSGVGSEVQKPLAIVVTGGLITSVSVTLFIIPLLFYFYKNSSKKILTFL